MIYRRLFHTRVSFTSRYIINSAVIIRESFVKVSWSFVYHKKVTSWLLECRNCVGKCRLHFCLHSKKSCIFATSFNNYHICVIDRETIKNIIFNDSTNACDILNNLYISSFISNYCMSLVRHSFWCSSRVVDLAIACYLFSVGIYHQFRFGIKSLFPNKPHSVAVHF